MSELKNQPMFFLGANSPKGFVSGFGSSYSCMGGWHTYIIKGATHVGGDYGSDYADFLVWLLTYDGEFYAGASERYPQFMVSDSDLSLSSFE